MKCSICKKNIEETFLKKILGTIIKDSKGKKIAVCSECQKTLQNDKNRMLEKV